MQCAAVRICLSPINEPPHQNSVLLGPCKKMAAIHGHRPGKASSPPTTRNFGTSGRPQSIISRKTHKEKLNGRINSSCLSIIITITIRHWYLNVIDILQNLMFRLIIFTFVNSTKKKKKNHSNRALDNFK